MHGLLQLLAVRWPLRHAIIIPHFIKLSRCFLLLLVQVPLVNPSQFIDR